MPRQKRVTCKVEADVEPWPPHPDRHHPDAGQSCPLNPQIADF